VWLNLPKGAIGARASLFDQAMRKTHPILAEGWPGITIRQGKHVRYPDLLAQCFLLQQLLPLPLRSSIVRVAYLGWQSLALRCVRVRGMCVACRCMCACVLGVGWVGHKTTACRELHLTSCRRCYRCYVLLFLRPALKGPRHNAEPTKKDREDQRQHKVGRVAEHEQPHTMCRG
jgi:hypothetical protein